MKLNAQDRATVAGEMPSRWTEKALELGRVTDGGLHHKCVLEVTDSVTILRRAFINASPGGTALQSVGVLAVAQSVDEGSKLAHVSNAACHHHLLLDEVGLR